MSVTGSIAIGVLAVLFALAGGALFVTGAASRGLVWVLVPLVVVAVFAVGLWRAE